MKAQTLYVDGIGFWSPGLPGWPEAREALRDAAVASAPTTRPAPAILAPNERRRAPDTVLVALEVASRALEGSGHAGKVATVFTSAHGDLAIIDALCRTLADHPQLLSPTRFHHSVHNAASGYWAIGSGSTAASTALASYEHSFVAGLLEAVCQCAADAQPVLLVAYDSEARGPLASVNRSRGLLGLALLLSPQRSAASQWSLEVSMQDVAPATPPRSAAAQALARNASAPGLPLFEALATPHASDVTLELGAAQALTLRLTPLSAEA